MSTPIWRFLEGTWLDGNKSKDPADAIERLLAQTPCVRGFDVVYHTSWTVQEALDQQRYMVSMLRQGNDTSKQRLQLRHFQVKYTERRATQEARLLRSAVAVAAAATSRKVDGGVVEALGAMDVARRRVIKAKDHFCLAQKMFAVEQQGADAMAKHIVKELTKCTQELRRLVEAVDDLKGRAVAKQQGREVNPQVDESTGKPITYCSNCKVGGHGERFCKYFLARPGWRVCPSELWMEPTHAGGPESYCPLGRLKVDFTDETHFSRISMHLAGKMWLEDKRKLYEFVPELMPLTYVIKDGQWIGDVPKEDPDAELLPWFVKETDRNWGTSVACCLRPEECMPLVKPEGTYVVQKHIPKPLLYDKGEKCHIKFYNLIVGLADGKTWRVYTYKNGYLSISPNPWSPTDISKDTQVTIIRSKRVNDWAPWDEVYPKCKAGVAEVMRRAAQQGKLIGRDKVQFEIISADFIVDTDMNVYLLEFNTGPVLRDETEAPDVHDSDAIRGALHIVDPVEGGTEDLWDFALEVEGSATCAPSAE